MCTPRKYLEVFLSFRNREQGIGGSPSVMKSFYRPSGPCVQGDEPNPRLTKDLSTVFICSPNSPPLTVTKTDTDTEILHFLWKNPKDTSHKVEYSLLCLRLYHIQVPTLSLPHKVVGNGFDELIPGLVGTSTTLPSILNQFHFPREKHRQEPNRETRSRHLCLVFRFGSSPTHL